MRKIGWADDDAPADGIDLIDFHQALQRAEYWFETQSHEAIPDELLVHAEVLFDEIPPAPPYTVGHAVKDYIRWYRDNRKDYRRSYYVAKRHIMDQIGSIPIVQLTAPQIETWLTDLSRSAPTIPIGRNGKKRFGPISDDPEWRRRRRASANKVLVLLKAALNHAFDRGYVQTDRAWAVVKVFRRTIASHEPKHLTLDEVHRLIDVSPAPIAEVIKGGLVTGCRIGDLLKMRVNDFLPDLGRIKVVARKTDRFYHVTLSEEGREFFETLTLRRPTNEHMFLNEFGKPWSYNSFRKGFVTAQFDADFPISFNFHRLRHTFAAQAVMAGIPLKAVANQLGHATTLMVEQRYGHLRDDFISEKVREVMPRLFT